jgi:hypothetical protein
MKRSEIVISLEGGLLFDPPEIVFKPEEAMPLGVSVCWEELPIGPEGAVEGCEVELAGVGVKPMLEDIGW